MTREEAIAKGLEVYDTQHSMKRRSPWHNYSRKGTYMITLVVDGRKPLLGKLVANNPSAKLEGTGTNNPSAKLGGTGAEAAYVKRTELGRAIETEEILKISHYYPMVDVWKLCVMPDHLHIILRVKEDMPRGKHLGKIISGFKSGCNKAYWRICPSAKPEGTGTNNPSAKPEGTGAEAAGGLFEAGYNDKILLHEGQLDNWKAYLDDNPRRLWMKQQNPQLFSVLYNMEIAERKCQIVGNRFLLDIPDKVAVIVHRHYTDEENVRYRAMWLNCGERGGVLVSAAISQKEKEVLREAMDRGYRIILLRENGFPELYKPSGESFYACSAGLLLQISPWAYHMERKTITRAQCLELNEMAERIANNPSAKLEGTRANNPSAKLKGTGANNPSAN